VSVTGGKSLAVFTDASGQFWYTVPGYGPVNWPVERISEHARYVVETHRPDRGVMAMRPTWGFLPSMVWRSRRCKVCMAPWTCRDARWAGWWFTSLEQRRPSGSAR